MEATVLNKPQSVQDSAWKDILDVYLEDCISYCLPAIRERYFGSIGGYGG